MAIYKDMLMSAHYRIGQREKEERYRKVWTRRAKVYLPLPDGGVDSLRMINNTVLLKVSRRELASFEVDLDGGGKFEMNTRFNEIYFAPTYCEVVKLPERLRYNLNDMNVESEWETDIEVEVGDHVVARFLPIVQALGMADSKGSTRCFYSKEGELYILVNYKDLIVRLREREDVSGSRFGAAKALFSPDGKTGDGEYDVYPLNGWVITEPIEDREGMLERDGFYGSGKFGRIIHVGSRVRRYKYAYSWDCGSLEEGHVTLFTHMGDSELMRGYLNRLGRDFRRIPRRHCLCMIQNKDGGILEDSELWE